MRNFQFLENQLATTIHTSRPVAGGDINEAFCLETTKGIFFVKTNSSLKAKEMFKTEADGLAALRATKCIKVPKVLTFGEEKGSGFLVLEWIESGLKTEQFWIELGHQLAQLHVQPQAYFGWDSDNFIGTLPQTNQQFDNWVDFYTQERLNPQFQLAFDKKLLNSQDLGAMEQLYQKLGGICPKEKASLIHGDLWSGNFMANEDSIPYLIDPAVAFAHREMDIAMTKLFGGFSPLFYEAYNEIYPLEKGFEKRVEVYQLYYLLVHVNLFGSGYVNSVRQILQRY